MNPVFKIAAEQSMDIALHVFNPDGPAIGNQQFVGLSQNRTDGAAGVAPFVDDLFKHAGIGMLWNEARPQHFKALTRDLLDNRRIVQKPPAAEGQEVSELACNHTEFVLILAAQHADQESVVGKLQSDILNGVHIGAADTVARKTQCGIDLAANAVRISYRSRLRSENACQTLLPGASS